MRRRCVPTSHPLCALCGLPIEIKKGRWLMSGLTFCALCHRRSPGAVDWVMFWVSETVNELPTHEWARAVQNREHFYAEMDAIEEALS